MEFITLKPDSFPKNQIMNRLEAHSVLINPYAREFFLHPAFTTEHAREMTIAIASLREIGLENGATLHEIFQQIRHTHLKPCPANTGLFLRLIWKNQPQSHNSILSGTHCSPEQAVVVLSEPFEADDAFPKGLYLRNVDGRLWLRGYVCDSEYRFSSHDVFAFEKCVAENSCADLDLSGGQEAPMTTIKVGDWVTQYSAGYWNVVNIFPKYADEDYNYNGQSWKKGDHLGDWVILKKGFTPKMKPSNACEFVDAQWCKPVSAEIAQSIEAMFEENPKARQKFEKAPNMPKPAVASTWLALSEEQAEAFSRLILSFPERFTSEQFWAWSADYRKHIVDPSGATHILYLFSYLWEISDGFEPLHFGPELKKL